MTPQEKIKLADALLQKHLDLGFGSQPKSELDLLVFHHISTSNTYKKLSNYELASALKIPESRIKRLKLDSALRYQNINPKAILGHIVLRTLDGLQVMDIRNSKIEISLENPLEKRELEHYLKKGGHSAEYTLNSEVLKIEPIRLLELMIDNLDNAEKEFAKALKDSLKDKALSDKILGKNSSTDKQIKRARHYLTDSSRVISICKAIGIAVA